MKRRTLSMMCIAVLSCVGLTASRGMADDDQHQSVAVAFGRGLNTAQQGNMVNHVMLPDDVTIKLGGVVHFLVAGFHEPVVFKPGTDVDDVKKIVPATATFILDPTKPKPADVFYLGINPAGGNPPTQATPANPIVAGSDTRSNARNRVESVGFPAKDGKNRTTGVVLSEKAEPGLYLVICNVTEHFNDGMFGFVEVKKPEN